MRLSDQISLTVTRLQHHPWRTGLTALGLLVSSAAMLLLIGVSLGTQRTAQNQFSDLAELRQIVLSPQANDSGVLNRTAQRKIAGLPGVQTVIPRQEGQFFQALHIGNYFAFGVFYGIGVDDLQTLGYAAEAGVTALKEGSVVVNQDFLDSFWVLTPGFRPYRAEELVGYKFTLKLTHQGTEGRAETKNVRLKIVGVLKPGGGQEKAPMIFMRLEDVQSLNRWVSGRRVDDNRAGFSNLIVLAKQVSMVKPLAERLADFGYTASANLTMAKGVSSTYALIQIALGGAGMTALLVGIVTLINTMTTEVFERTREIGLMKTLGASQGDVLRLFLGEAAGIGLLGSSCGVLLGALAGLAIDRVGRAYLIAHGAPASLSIDLPPWLFAATLLLTPLVACLAGLSPALQVSRLPPVAALKRRR